MEFVFNETKAAQAAMYLLAEHGKQMPYMKLLKLLYLADREAFIESGYPITGDDMYSLKRGPILSRVLNLMRGGLSLRWGKYIARAGTSPNVVLIGPYETDRLSEYEMEVLARINSEFGHLDQWHLERYTHDHCPEWTDPGSGRLPIDPEAILRAAGKSEGEIADIISQIDAVSAFNNRFAQAR